MVNACFQKWVRCFGLIVVLGGFSVGSPTEAAESVRVALVQGARQIHVTSSRAMQLRFSSGKSMEYDVPLRISTSGGGLEINGKRARSQTVSIRGRRRELILSKRNGQKWTVSGSVEVQNNAGRLLVLNRVNLEKYVAGVVSSEISSKWHEEALKTQAVAARTYVLHKKMLNRQQKYDVVASVQDQVYRGNGLVRDSIREAVDETRGMVVAHKNRPIFAAYSSTAAGPTEDAFNVWEKDLPYLKGVDCPFDEESPRFRWQATIRLNDMEQHLRKEGYTVGTVATLTPFGFTRAGRVNEVRILHSKGEIILGGQDFRRVMGYSKILSTQFSIDSFGPEVLFSGKGAGHAVGMCQWGAKKMAELGYRYQSILQYYYPGTDLLHRQDIDMSPPDSSS